MRAARYCVVFVTFASVTSALRAQGTTRTLSGRVVDTTGAPVVYANIELAARVTVSDDSGRFSMSIPVGPVGMAVRRIGFRMLKVDLPSGADTTVRLVMTPVAHTLSRQVVSTDRTIRSLELRGFYRRLHDRKYGTNAGHFITAEEIERRNPTRITQMFEGLTGVRTSKVREFGSDDGCSGTQNLLCWAPQGLGGCWMTVYYDGVRLLNTSRMREPNSPTVVDAHVVPGHIAGIEVYTSPGKVPAEYQGLNGTCGVVLLWSK